MNGNHQPISLRAQLFDVLTRCYILDELRILCFHIDVDFNEIKGDTKSYKAVELIEYCFRHNIYEQLIVAIQKEHPEIAINWQIKIIVVLNQDVDFLRSADTRERFVTKLAGMLNAKPEDIHILMMAEGSVRILLAVPKEKGTNLQNILQTSSASVREIITAFQVKSMSQDEVERLETLLNQLIEAGGQLAELITHFHSKALELLADGTWHTDLILTEQELSLNRQGRARLKRLLLKHKQELIEQWIQVVKQDSNKGRLSELVTENSDLVIEILTNMREGIFIYGG